MPGQKIRTIVDCDGVADRLGLSLSHAALAKLGWLHGDPTLSEESFVLRESKWESTKPFGTEIHIYFGTYKNFGNRRDIFTVEVTIKWTSNDGWYAGEIVCIHANSGKVTFCVKIDWPSEYPVYTLGDPLVWPVRLVALGGRDE